MRKIKFRMWDTGENRFMSHSRVIESRILALEGNGEERFVFQQYTGLSDKNGVDIYEGDVVETGWQGDTKGVVIFEQAMFFVKSGDSTMYFNHPDRYEVIGNIHEHPHLLGKPND